MLDVMAYQLCHAAPTDPVEGSIKLTQARCALAQALVPEKARLQWLAVLPAEGWHDANPTVLPDPNVTFRAIASGATAGAIKSLGQEWAIDHRVVYIDLTMAAPEWLEAEIGDTTSNHEIIYRDGLRWLPALVSTEAATPHPRALPEKPVFLITGGGLGITASIAGQMAHQIGPFRALILGRTVPANAEELAILEDPKAARKMIKLRLGADASARQVQEALQREKRRVELARGLLLLQATGIEVLYVPTDVQQMDAVNAAVAQAVDTWGQIDGVIHGAGVDKSRAIEQKNPEEIDLVMGVKLRGLRHLVAALQDQPIHHWLAFGSISARFGNGGQFDYAAANEALSRWIAAAFGDGLIVDYTGWDEVGMAASLASIMKERGVDMLPPQAAASATIDLLTSGHTGEWVCSGRLPAFQQNDPLLGSADNHVPGSLLQTTRHLTTGKHRYLTDHQLQGAELMPGVVSLMSMRQAAAALCAGAQLHHSIDIQFAKAVKVWSGHPLAMTIEAEQFHEANGPIIATSISSSRERKGQVEETHHAAAIFYPGVSLAHTEPKELLTPSPDEDAVLLDAAEVYETFFHGPCWQVVDNAAISEDFAQASAPSLGGALGEDLEDSLRWEAVGLELLLQTAGLWIQKIPQSFALPFGIESWTFYASPEAGSTITAHIRPSGQRGDLYLFTGALFDQDQQLLQEVTGLQMRIFPMP